MLGEGDDDLNIRVIATYQSSDGLMELKVAMTGFMTEVMGRMVSSIPSLTSGATSVIEILSFCLADQGNAFLVPTPYYPGLIFFGVSPFYDFKPGVIRLSTCSFDRDMRWWTGMKLIPVHHCSCDDFTFSIKALDQALSMKKVRSKEFVSMTVVLNSQDSDRDRVHIYGLSKDFFLPGFRVGEWNELEFDSN